MDNTLWIRELLVELGIEGYLSLREVSMLNISLIDGEIDEYLAAL